MDKNRFASHLPFLGPRRTDAFFAHHADFATAWNMAGDPLMLFRIAEAIRVAAEVADDPVDPVLPPGILLQFPIEALRVASTTIDAWPAWSLRRLLDEADRCLGPGDGPNESILAREARDFEIRLLRDSTHLAPYPRNQLNQAAQILAKAALRIKDGEFTRLPPEGEQAFFERLVYGLEGACAVGPAFADTRPDPFKAHICDRLRQRPGLDASTMVAYLAALPRVTAIDSPAATEVSS